MSIVIILIGLIIGVLTCVYSFDRTNLGGILSGTKKDKIKELLVVIAVATITYVLYYYYDLTIYFIAMELTSLFLIITSIIDYRDKQIPIDIVIITLALGVILLFFNQDVTLIQSIIGFLGIGGVIALISIITKGAIGMGDALVIGTMGLILGYQMALTVLLYSLVLSGLMGLVLMVFGKVNRKTKMPMVPFVLCVFLIIVML